nr:hypothetical protein [Lachnospiraceae bacterium]
HFKPDYSLHALRSNNYICHASCFSRELFEKAGDFRKEFDGSQDHDLILRLTEKADRIEHISKVLYFWRCHEESVASDISAKTYAIDAGINAVKAHLERNNILGTVESSPVFPVIYDVKYKIKGDPKVSIIVTSTGNARECVKNIKKNTSYANKEIFVCKSLEKRNAAAKSANGDYIVFVDDRLRFSDKHWLKNLLGVCMQKNSGAVSGKIIYKNGILRDAGIVLGAGANGIGANVLFRYKGDNEGYLGNMYFNREVSAVCDNLLMISKDNFLKVEGFNETLPEWYAGIDLSIKLNKTGVNNIVAPYVTATFMEKEKERGISGNFPSYSDLDEEFMEKHKEALSKPDPYYNENFDKRAANFIIKKIE